MADRSAAARTAYGGQAVIEGVMIRGKERVVTACRLKDGTIVTRHDLADGWQQRHAWMRLAFLRGTPALIDSLRLGYRTLMWSADQTMESEGQEKISPLATFFTFAAAILIGIGGFVLFPNWLTSVLVHAPMHLRHAVGPGFWAQFTPSASAILPNILEGIIRVLMLIGYILLVGRNPEIMRVFAYHGAEHKVVNAWEAGAELSVDGARPFSRIHPRCGTSFLFLVFIVGIVVHSLIGWPDNRLLLMASRLVLLFPVAGLAYELIRLAGRHRDSRLLHVLVWPGMLLQRLTTAEPQDDQIEVAVHAMRTVLEDEGVLQPEATVTAPLIVDTALPQPQPAGE